MALDIELLDQLKAVRGYTSDAELARALGVSPATIKRVRAGAEPSQILIASVALATGRGVGEVVKLAPIQRAAACASNTAIRRERPEAHAHSEPREEAWRRWLIGAKVPSLTD
ncbi:hypothetical protein [Nocardia terpenica]|uniref:Uncharacterized protein n=1 Tax=Nocardia terpenica TaxID=455432 RepID=A0A6G9Z6P7_9NOCA|nr:hypothetical protein [Nocardia terpenica]QIS21285.1 hypothetical protein F6W96_26110 [Nocardia terpenica]